jgi:hypothetical protein
LFSTKQLLLEIIKTIAISALTIVFSIWFTSSNSIEYKVSTINAALNIPAALKEEIKITNSGEEIKNISTVSFGLYNRSFSDYENVKIYIEIIDENPPKLISANLIPPDRLTKNGIKELRDSNDALIGYSVDVFKKSLDYDFYLISLIFEGDLSPKIKISTDTKNINITEYSDLQEWIVIIIFVTLMYAVILVPTIIIGRYSSIRIRNRHLARLKSRWAEGNLLNSEQIEFISSIYVEERDRKKESTLKKIINKITSTE